MTTWTEMSYNLMGREYEEDVLDVMKREMDEYDRLCRLEEYMMGENN